MESPRVEGSPGRRRPGAVEGRGRGRSRTERSKEPEAITFNSALLDADRRRRRQELERWLAAVDETAERLRRAPGEAHVYAYREAVRRFLEVAVSAGEPVVERRIGRDGQGGRRWQVVVAVQRELDELVTHVLEQQTGTLQLAARLLEIRGLLLDLVR